MRKSSRDPDRRKIQPIGWFLFLGILSAWLLSQSGHTAPAEDLTQKKDARKGAGASGKESSRSDSSVLDNPLDRAREKIGRTAQQHLHSNAWGYDLPPPERYKCNLYVHDMIAEAGGRAPVNPTTKRPVMAARWAGRMKVLQGWRIVEGGAAEARVGDVVAYHNPTYEESTGHVGIVIADGPTGLSISASGGGPVIIDDLGFDRKDHYEGRAGYVFRRWTGR